MTTDYDPIAEQYQRSKLQPWRTYIESPTLLELLGDLRGASVLDVACGEGFYTRLIRRRGAEKVTGVGRRKGDGGRFVSGHDRVGQEAGRTRAAGHRLHGG